MASAPPAAAELAAMIRQLGHRGPDGYGFHRDGEIGLAHARLSIIDVAGGWQPIHNEDKSAWVVLNGEIFNYIELRAALEPLGHRFYTQSDTEVIVHLYEEHGDDFVKHLNGQFAIALWDARRRRLVLARDRTGIRPLYYTTAGGRLLFASEIKALFIHPSVTRRLSAQGLGEVFTFWSTLGQNCVFEGVANLPPGCLLTFERGERKLARYWDWQFPESSLCDARPIESCAEELRELLVDAIRLQLRSDVPVGAYLSGGLDSSIITSVIKHFTEVPLRTFSLTFEDEEFDESVYQRELVDYLKTNHTALHCTRAAVSEAFPRAIWHAETPLVRTGPVPLMLLSALVRSEGYKVVLTGEGADEVFGGYDIFKEAKVRRFCARVPGSRLRPRIISRLYSYLKHSPTADPALAQRFFNQGMELNDKAYFAHIPRWSTTRRIWQFLSAEIKRDLDQRDPYAAIEAQLPSGIDRWLPLGKDQYIEAHTLLSGYLLSSQGDRMAMANSIEGRFPFLDHRLIAFANGLPARYKIRGLNEKYILKKSMAPWLPASIHRRSKQPYRAPDSQSFFANGRAADYVEELFSDRALRDRGYFEPVAVRKLYEKCRQGRAIGFGDNMAFVGILSTMLVDHMFLQGSRPRGVSDSRIPAGVDVCESSGQR